MSLIHIKSPELSAEQKIRIGDRIISAFHAEGLFAPTIVILFEREVADIYLEGGMLHEARASAPPPAPAPEVSRPPAPASPAPGPVPDFKSKLRRSKVELQDLKAQLVARLQGKGALSSFQAQIDLGLKACDWAPATLRRFFSELEEEGLITKQGQKRGTRYVWNGINTQQAPLAPGPRLVKRVEDGEN